MKIQEESFIEDGSTEVREKQPAKRVHHDAKVEEITEEDTAVKKLEDTDTNVDSLLQN